MPTACTVPGCGRPVVAREKCGTHYQRERRRSLGVRESRAAPVGEGALVQFRTHKRIKAAVESKAKSKGLTPREAWEKAGEEWVGR